MFDEPEPAPRPGTEGVVVGGAGVGTTFSYFDGRLLRVLSNQLQDPGPFPEFTHRASEGMPSRANIADSLKIFPVDFSRYWSPGAPIG